MCGLPGWHATADDLTLVAAADDECRIFV